MSSRPTEKKYKMAFLVFDVGGTFTKYALMDYEGTILIRGKQPTPSRPGHTKADLYALFSEIFRTVCINKIAGITISLPGAVDVEQGIVYGGGALNYMDGVPLGKELSALCGGIPVTLENDAKCAALCEVWKGNARDCNDACLLVLGTGVGGAIVKDRKVHRGKHLSAGEFSYCMSEMTRADLGSYDRLADGPLSIEDYLNTLHYTASAKISVAGLCNQAAHKLGIPFEEISGEKLYKWHDAGNADVTELLEDFCFHVAKFCCNLQVIYDPEVILIGGGISAEPRFIEGIRKYAEQLKGLTRYLQPMNIQPCRHRNDANLIGALYNFLTNCCIQDLGL